MISGIPAAALAVVVGLAATAHAGEQTARTGQWHARGASAAKTFVPATRAFAVRPAAARGSTARLQWTSSQIPETRSRAIRSAVRPVQYEEPAGFQLDPPGTSGAAASDDFTHDKNGESDKSDPLTLDSPQATGGAADDASASDAKSQPALLGDVQTSDSASGPSDDPPEDELDPAQLEKRYQDDPIPTPPDTEEPNPYGDLGEGIETPAWGPGCNGYDKRCKEAIAKLQERDITTVVVGVVIEGTEGTDFPCDCRLGRDFQAPKFAGRNFSPTLFTWKASGTCHKPLYFEDVQLERYGHSWNPIVQPFVSGAHFFASVPLLPYKMGLKPPHECVYTLGYYRPGNCAPFMFEPIPLSLRGAVWEGFGAAAFAFWFWPPN